MSTAPTGALVSDATSPQSPGGIASANPNTQAGAASAAAQLGGPGGFAALLIAAGHESVAEAGEALGPDLAVPPDGAQPMLDIDVQSLPVAGENLPPGLATDTPASAPQPQPALPSVALQMGNAAAIPPAAAVPLTRTSRPEFSPSDSVSAAFVDEPAHVRQGAGSTVSNGRGGALDARSGSVQAPALQRVDSEVAAVKSGETSPQAEGGAGGVSRTAAQALLDAGAASTSGASVRGSQGRSPGSIVPRVSAPSAVTTSTPSAAASEAHGPELVSASGEPRAPSLPGATGPDSDSERALPRTEKTRADGLLRASVAAALPRGGAVANAEPVIATAPVSLAQSVALDPDIATDVVRLAEAGRVNAAVDTAQGAAARSAGRRGTSSSAAGALSALVADRAGENLEGNLEAARLEVRTSQAAKLTDLLTSARAELTSASASNMAARGPAAHTATPALAIPAAAPGATSPLAANLAAPGLVADGNSLSVDVPFQSARWDGAVGQRLVQMARQGVQSAELTLNPRDLGRLDVRLAVQQDQASVSFVTNHASVREALEASVPRLREMMTEGGLDLVNVDVSHDRPDTSGHQASDGDASGPTRSAPATAADTQLPAPPPANSTSGVIDFYA